MECAIFEDKLIYIPVEQVEPNPDQPRTEFDEAELLSLSESIVEHGLVQAVTVREKPDGSGYYLIDGERRLRAHKLANLETIKAVVKGSEPEQKESLVEAVIANSQRSDLNPIDEAKSFQRLIKSAGYTQGGVADLVGKSKTYISMRLKLLDFEPEVQHLFAKKKLTIDPALIYGIAALPAEIRVDVMKRCVQNNLTVSGMKRRITNVTIKYVPGSEPNLTKSKKAPAIQVSGKKEDQPAVIFSLLAKTGDLPQWKMVEDAAAETCKNCPLSDMASDDFCSECTAVDLIRRMTKKAKA